MANDSINSKYLNGEGLSIYDNIIKEWIENKLTPITNDEINALFESQNTPE
jgi:hypothetical protein